MVEIVSYDRRDLPAELRRALNRAPLTYSSSDHIHRDPVRYEWRDASAIVVALDFSIYDDDWNFGLHAVQLNADRTGYTGPDDVLYAGIGAEHGLEPSDRLPPHPHGKEKTNAEIPR